MQIKQRWLLGLLVATGQLVVLLVGVIWFLHWLEATVGQIVRERVSTAVAESAEQATDLIEELEIDDATPGTPGWRRLQRLVERVRLPNEGFLCVIDTDGLVICHPHLRNAVEGGTPTTAEVTVPRGGDFVSTSELPGLGLTVLAYQRADAVQGVIDRFMRRVQLIAVMLIVVVAVFSALVTAAIVQRYENRLARINENLEGLVAHRSRKLLKTRGAVIRGLATLAESRDRQTGQHLDRIGKYVRILGEELSKEHDEIDDDFVDTLEETSCLHDIGKVGVPDGVLLSPDRLTEDQRDSIQKHPLIGGDTLLAVKRQWGDDPFLVTACEICFAHHERWDGRGYPFGLAGDDIPLAARIVALADVYDALTTARVYKPAMPHEEARQLILESSGTHFDPQVVAAFDRREAEFREVADALRDGR